MLIRKDRPMENIRFVGKNKDFKVFLEKAKKDLEDKEKRSCTSANVHTPIINTSNKLYTKFII